MPMDNVEAQARNLALKIVSDLREHPEQADSKIEAMVETFKDVYAIGAAEAQKPQDLTKEEVQEKTKNLLLSKTFWGIVMGFVASVAPHAGLHIGSAEQTQYASYAVQVVGTALAIYGRIKATQTIALRATKDSQ